MSVSPASSAALLGLAVARQQMDQIASRLATAGIVEPGSINAADLSQQMIGLLAAKRMFQANVQVARTAADLENHLLDLLA